MEDLKRVIDSLHSLERRVLPLLEKYRTAEEITKNSGMLEIEVIRALQWLQNKKIINLETKETNLAALTGKAEKLPERILMQSLDKNYKTLDELKKITRLNDNELNACIGLLKRKNVIDVNSGKKFEIRLNENSNSWLKEKTPEEILFEKLKNKKIPLIKLNAEEKNAFGNLHKRGLATEEKIKEISANLTELGYKISKEKIETNVIDHLTPEVIREKLWLSKKIRGYDIKANVPRMQRGRRHFVRQTIEYVKKIWLDLGFTELQGNIVQTAFWNMDALFIPQDHSAREMQDTFFVGKKGEILSGKIPHDLAEKIKKIHENGSGAGSRGWGGKWKTEAAKEVLLRTHTTVLSALALANLKKENLPAKFFSIGKVYRNEALDWKHLFEFYQVEGIVVDPDANLRHLIGYLKEFYKKMGFEKIRVKPSFFPYTSPSLEIAVWHSKKKEWIEVGGAGIFRPEVTKPLLGFECPVLAWGQGLERILVDYYKIHDLRNIYGNDLKMLREIKEFAKWQ